MKKYTFNRIWQALIVLLGVYTLTFFIVNVIPGDPVYMMLNKRADAETIELVRHQLGMDRPLPVQYADHLRNIFHGSLGVSYMKKVPVLDLILSGFKVTFSLGLRAFLFAAAIGVPVGVLAALFRGRAIDKLVMLCAMLGLSMPSFWLAVILQIIFGLTLRLLPISGMDKPGSMVLPMIAVGLSYAASMARLVRTSVLDVLSADYVRTAHAKGLRGGAILLRHIMKNAAIPIITMFGLQLRSILGGTMIIEQIFSLPGLGSVAIDAIMSRDIPVIEGTVLYSAFLFVLINLLVDLLYGLFDPRVRVAQKGGA